MKLERQRRMCTHEISVLSNMSFGWCVRDKQECIPKSVKHLHSSAWVLDNVRETSKNTYPCQLKININKNLHSPAWVVDGVNAQKISILSSTSAEWRERDQQKCVPIPIKYLYFLAWVVSDVRRKQQGYIHTHNHSVLSGVFSQHFGTVSDVSVGCSERERVKRQENISEAWNVLARLFDEEKGREVSAWMYGCMDV